jgi:hypothetical protein
MRYRISRHPFSINGFNPVRTVSTNVGWNPTFSYTRDGRKWVPAREPVRSNDPERPYSKYVGDGNRRIHGIFTEGLANHFKNSLHSLRYEHSNLFAASGRRLGSLRSVPLHISKLDRIYKFTKARGSAWPHDIALTSEDRPRIVYTRRVGHRDAFFYAYHNGGLPVAPQRRLPPGRGVVHPGQRAHLALAPADLRERPLLHPPRHAAWPAGGEHGAVLPRRPLDEGLHRLPHAHPRAPGRRPADLAASRRDRGGAPPARVSLRPCSAR